MGKHDTHPIFTGYHLEKLGYYNAANITMLQWDRNPFSQDFEVIAHGLNEDTAAARFHIVKVKSPMRSAYFVEGAPAAGHDHADLR